MKKYINAIILIGILPFQAHAKGGAEIFDLAYDNIIPLLAILVILAVMITFFNMVFNFLDFQKLRMQQEMGLPVEEVAESMKIPSWKKINDWMWSLVPKDKEDSIDLGHAYDGIRELDNKLPPWWLGLFYGGIVFAAIYMYVYEWGPNEWSSKMEYELAMEDAEEQKRKYFSKMTASVDENSVVFVEDQANLLLGEEIFVKNCAACHGAGGEGLVGPNLTDDYWVHGGSIKDIFKTIKYGVPEKGMIAWSSQLKPGSMQNVASYIQTLHGTNPPNQKAQEGTLYVPEEQAVVPLGSDEGSTTTEEITN